jgi:zinc metalloprotease ZmpA
MSASYKLLAFAIAAALSGTATAAVGSNDPAAGRALTLIKLNTVPTRTSTGDAFVARDVVIDTKTGTEHVRFDRTYNGLRVLGGDLVVHSRP